MLLIVALLSRFKGELHLSSNGYLLLKRSIGGSNNDALNPETRRTNTTTFEVKINGDRIYWMSWWDDFEVDRIDGSRVDRFFVLSEHYGLTEFHAWRTPEKLNYKIINNMLVFGSVFLQRKVIHHHMAADKESAPSRMNTSVNYNIECLALLFGLHAAPVHVSVDKTLAAAVLYQQAAYIALRVGHAVAPQKARHLLAQLCTRKHTH